MTNTSHHNPDENKSSEALEREVNQARARLNSRAHELGDRLSPGELLDQSLHLVRDHAGEFGHNLGAQIKNNPVPTIITGVGMAWMMLASNRPVTHYYEPATSIGSPDYDDGESHHDMMDAAGNKLKHTADKARHMRDSVRSHAGDAAGNLRSQADHTRHQFQSFLQDQPIVAGGLGLALGAFLGSLLPSTEVEDKTLGHARDKVASKAGAMASQKYDEVKEQARDVGESVKSSLKDKTQDGNAARHSANTGSTGTNTLGTGTSRSGSAIGSSTTSPGGGITNS